MLCRTCIYANVTMLINPDFTKTYGSNRIRNTARGASFSVTVYILQRLREKDVERVSVQEEDSIVLSPQRRSFLTGCQATQVSRMLVLGTFLVQGGVPETLIYFTGLWIRVHMGPLLFFSF